MTKLKGSYANYTDMLRNFTSLTLLNTPLCSFVCHIQQFSFQVPSEKKEIQKHDFKCDLGLECETYFLKVGNLFDLGWQLKLLTATISYAPMVIDKS